MFETPILLLLFNRPDLTSALLSRLELVKPKHIYVVSDGPRENVVGESAKVEECRNLVSQQITWECQVHLNYRKSNLGCKDSVSQGISWFFDRVKMGIILEDDCLPELSFFDYCETLLWKYENDPSVMAICGDNHGMPVDLIYNNYAFVKYPLIWGWATWSNVWQNYDVEIKDWPEFKTLLNSPRFPRLTQRYLTSSFNKVFRKELDTWDYQFMFLVIKNEGMCVIPRINQITNVGFGEGATHTLTDGANLSNLKTGILKNFDIDEGRLEKDSQLSNAYLESFFKKEPYLTELLKKIIKKFH